MCHQGNHCAYCGVKLEPAPLGGTFACPQHAHLPGAYWYQGRLYCDPRLSPNVQFVRPLP